MVSVADLVSVGSMLHRPGSNCTYHGFGRNHGYGSENRKTNMTEFTLKLASFHSHIFQPFCIYHPSRGLSFLALARIDCYSTWQRTDRLNQVKKCYCDATTACFCFLWRWLNVNLNSLTTRTHVGVLSVIYLINNYTHTWQRYGQSESGGQTWVWTCGMLTG